MAYKQHQEKTEGKSKNAVVKGEEERLYMHISD